MIEFEVVEEGALGDDVLEKGPQVRDVPLAISEFVNESAFGFVAGNEEGMVKGSVRGLDPERGVQNQEGLSHRIHNVLCVKIFIEWSAIGHGIPGDR